MSPSFSDLPQEIVELICQKLIDIKDYARFGAVCPQWLLVLSRCCRNIPSPQPPVLLLPNSSLDTENYMYTHRFFFPTDTNKGYVLPNIKEHIHPLGSSHGWLITASYTQIELVNPFSSVNNVISLPGIDSLNIITKFVLSANPAFTANYVVMVIYIPCDREGSELAFIRSGNIHWTRIDQEKPFSDVIYNKQQFYAVAADSGKIYCFDVTFSSTDDDQPYKLTKVLSPSATRTRNYYSHRYLVGSGELLFTRTRNYHLHRYLVETGGELLYIERELNFRMNDGLSPSFTIGFEIFKLETRKQEWIEVKTLGGHALFLGQNSSISVLASDHPLCRPDHIYFTGDTLSHIRVFDLKLGRFEELLHVPEIWSTTNCRHSLWVQPTLNVTETCKHVLPSSAKDAPPSSQPACVYDTAQNSDTETLIPTCDVGSDKKLKKFV